MNKYYDREYPEHAVRKIKQEIDDYNDQRVHPLHAVVRKEFMHATLDHVTRLQKIRDEAVKILLHVQEFPECNLYTIDEMFINNLKEALRSE